MHTPVLLHPRQPLRDRELAVMLHGYGSNEQDLYALHSYLPDQLYPVALRGFLSTPFGGYGWYPLYVEPTGEIFARDADMMEAVKKLLEDLEELKKRFRYEGPLHLIGFSQGSILAYLLMGFAPYLFQNIVAFSGYIHESVMPPLTPSDTRGLAVFASHGKYDDIIPVEWARKIPDILRPAGVRLTYKEYESGHYISSENLNDAVAFLEENL